MVRALSRSVCSGHRVTVLVAQRHALLNLDGGQAHGAAGHRTSISPSCRSFDGAIPTPRGHAMSAYSTLAAASSSRKAKLWKGTPPLSAWSIRCETTTAFYAGAAAPHLTDERDPQSDSPLSISPHMSLRPYQEECIVECISSIAAGHTRIGVSSPTGSGKTTMFTHLIHLLPPLPPATRFSAPATRALIIVNSVELALQAAKAMTVAYPDKWVEIEQGARYVASGLADVTVATYQTLLSGNRLDKFDPRAFKVVVVDEAHHAAAPSYLRLLSYFDPRVGSKRPKMAEGQEEDEDATGVDEAEAAAREDAFLATSANDSKREAESPPPPTQKERHVPIVGFSATFSRHDGLALGTVFDRIVFHRDFLDMIREKWLCPVRFTSVKAQVDLAAVEISRASGDFKTSSLASVINTPAINRLVVKAWLEKAWNPSKESTSSSTFSEPGYRHLGDGQVDVEKKGDVPAPTMAARRHRSTTLVFCVDVAHVESLTDEFRRTGIDARFVYSGTPAKDRAVLMKDFRQGKFPVLVNCSILTEGADVPSIDCVLLARPTRSRNLFSQMIGRGMRLSPSTGKQDCLVLDLVGNIERGVVCTPTLFGLSVEEEIEGESSGVLRALKAGPETVDSLTARAEQERLAREASASNDEEGSGEKRPPFDIADPSKVFFIDYADPEAVTAAFGSKGSGVVETMSRNAWVDCGGDVYVLECSRKGYIRVQRGGENDGAPWIAYFVPAMPSPTEADYAVAEANPRSRRATYPYRRRQNVLQAEELAAAIRGADTYATTRVLPGAQAGYLSRWAKWRVQPASEKQRELVEKRLGLKKSGSPLGSSRKDAEEEEEREREEGGGTLGEMTKGQATNILTRLSHGLKGRMAKMEKESRKREREERRKEKERLRVSASMVKVGPLEAS